MATARWPSPALLAQSMSNCPFPTPARLYTPPAHALHKMPPLRESKTERGSAKRYEAMDPRASPVPFNMNPSSSPEELQTTPTPVAKGRKIARLEADTFRWSLQVGTAAESLGSVEEEAVADDVGNGLDEYELDSECGPGSLADLVCPTATNVGCDVLRTKCLCSLTTPRQLRLATHARGEWRIEWQRLRRCAPVNALGSTLRRPRMGRALALLRGGCCSTPPERELGCHRRTASARTTKWL